MCEAVERAAGDSETAQFEALGHGMAQRQPANLGYAMPAVKAGAALKLEVKGSDAAFPHFFLSRNRGPASSTSSQPAMSTYFTSVANCASGRRTFFRLTSQSPSLAR
jgi:hypothetical protein